MPADLLGTNVFNQKTQDVRVPCRPDLHRPAAGRRDQPHAAAHPGGAARGHAGEGRDPRRRAPRISPVFTVFATQNPIEFEGTYPLPEAQRDRFLLKISIDYPQRGRGGADARRLRGRPAPARRRRARAGAGAHAGRARWLPRRGRRGCACGSRSTSSATSWASCARPATHEAVQIGAGPRASLALLESSRALAALRGRDFVTPDDVKELAGPVLAHRVILTPGSRDGRRWPWRTSCGGSSRRWRCRAERLMRPGRRPRPRAASVLCLRGPAGAVRCRSSPGRCALALAWSLAIAACGGAGAPRG